MIYIERNGIVFQVDPDNPHRRHGPAIMAAVMIGGMALQTKATLDEGKQAAAVGKYQQQQFMQEAEATRQAGQYESRQKRKEGQRLMAQQVAQAGAQGGQITGSNLAILADTAKEIEADALMIQHNYDVKATQLENQGAIARYKGRVARSAARTRAFADLGMGLGSMYLMGGFNSFSGTKLAGNKAAIKQYGGLNKVSNTAYTRFMG